MLPSEMDVALAAVIIGSIVLPLGGGMLHLIRQVDAIGHEVKTHRREIDTLKSHRCTPPVGVKHT